MSTQANLVRLVAEYRGGERERLWGELVRPGVARVHSISHHSDLSYGDLVKVSPLCSCNEEHEHYEIGQRVFRASRRVQFFTSGTDELYWVRAYLLSWPGKQHAVAAPGWVGSEFLPDGVPAGISAYPWPEPDEGDTHWRISFPWGTSKRKAAAFLDGVPGLIFHELEPDEGDE